ncbi:hypothetical protein HY251_21675 [bacterium]|nr:hypothetical protein [bacterium]
MGIGTCNNHPNLAASYHCAQCHKPLCDRCIVNSKFCSLACSAKNAQFEANYKRPAELRRSAIPGILFFLAVAGGLYYLLHYHFHYF